MREILFRGKRVDNGEWIYGNLIEHYDILDRRIKYFYIESYTGEDRDEVIQETIGQFTGFVDEKARKIFEDDILKCVERVSNSWINTGTGQRGSNSWENNITVIVEFTPASLQRLDYYYRCCKEFKVVGNTHEKEEVK